MDGDDVPFSIITQLKLEMLLGMRRELIEMEESIAVALSKGAAVDPGIHTAELVIARDEDGVAVRDESGHVLLKLVIR